MRAPTDTMSSRRRVARLLLNVHRRLQACGLSDGLRSLVDGTDTDRAAFAAILETSPELCRALGLVMIRGEALDAASVAFVSALSGADAVDLAALLRAPL